MDARLTEEQQILRDTVAKLASELAPASVAALPAQGPGSHEWNQLAEIGLLGMRIPEEAGGCGFSGVEVVLAAEELGRRLVALPFIGSAVSCTSLLVAAGASNEVLESLATGGLRLALALDPTLGRPARLGEQAVGWDTRGVDAVLALDPGRHTLIALRPGEAALDSVDLTRELRPVAPQPVRVDIGDLGGPLEPAALDRWLALTLAALSADLVGLMDAALEAAVSHVSSREQFGVPVGTFQAVQHLASEAKVSAEAAHGLACYAGWAIDALDLEQALLAARTAKAYCSERAREVIEASMQLHGGVAFTWEYNVHVLARRALLSRQTLGDEHAQLDVIADGRVFGSPGRERGFGLPR